MGIIVLLVWILNASKLVRADLCPVGEKIRVANIYTDSHPAIFDDLTRDELQSVNDFMIDQRELFISAPPNVTIDSAFIYQIEHLLPPKLEVLEFLDNNGNRPKRFAVVKLFRGDVKPHIGVIEQYKVGPLPDIEGYELLNSSAENRPYEFSNFHTIMGLGNIYRNEFITNKVSIIDDILEKVTGYRLNNCSSEKCLKTSSYGIGRYNTNQHSFWVIVFRNHEGSYLHPIGLEFRVNTLGEDKDITNWLVDYVWFKGEHYANFVEMVDIYEIPNDSDHLVFENNNDLFSSLNQRGEPVPKHKQRGPRSFMPDGRRYTVDAHKVNWQGWSFHFNLQTTSGLQLHDVKFKDERIAYEVSPSEIAVSYGGETPTSQHMHFLDTVTLLGIRSRTLYNLLDCPDYATFFDFAHYYESNIFIYKRSACLFEHLDSIPLRRHFVNGAIQGVPGNQLKLRSSMTISNYQYILDYTFHQNGALQVTVSLSGYIMSTYHTGKPEDDIYSYEVYPGVSGPIHNHFCHFRMDLDILGASNRFQTLDIKVKKIKDPTDLGNMIHIQTFEKNLRKNEKNATCKTNFDTPKYYLFQNNDYKNKVGNSRGYRLDIHGTTKQLLPENWGIEPSFSWSRYQLAVTKHKDTERRDSTGFSMSNLYEPHINLQDYIDDDESIVDEDLVAWVTLGTFHIPHSDDIPIVQTPSLSMHIFLLPYNFFNEDPSLASRDNIRFFRGSYTGPDIKVNCQINCSNEMTSSNVIVILFSLSALSLFVLGLL